MKVLGVAPRKLKGIALDAGLDLTWGTRDGQIPRHQNVFFRVVPTGERYQIVEGSGKGRDACIHGYRNFLILLFQRGATFVETAIREYESLEDVVEESIVDVREEVEERYGKQTCRCLTKEDE